MAREMLVTEMRQRNNRERTGESSSGDEGRNAEGSNASQSAQTGNTDEHHPTEETPRHHYPNASAPPDPSRSATNGRSDGIDVDDIEPPNDYSSLPFTERIQHYFAQFVSWYHSQSDDIQTVLKVAACFLVLYVLLGGRFGLDYALGSGGKGVGRRGNYGEGNAYDRYSSSRRTSSTGSRYASDGDRYRDPYGDPSTHRREESDARRQASSGYNDRTNSQNDQYYSRYGNNHDNYYEPRGQRPRTSYRMPNLYDGSLVSMGILLAVWFACNRLGVNPFHALMMLNVMQGRGRRGRGYGGYGGMGGGGFGFGRQRYGMGRRGRGGFY